MARVKTPSFVAEFPLRTTSADEAELSSRFLASGNLKNACLGEALRRAKLMRESKDWQKARAMPRTLGIDVKGKPVPNKERSALFSATAERHGFSAGNIQKYAQVCRDSCWIGDHLGSHDTQTTSLRAFRAVEGWVFGRRGKPRFKSVKRLHSIEGKINTKVIRFHSGPIAAIHWAGLVLPLLLDRKDKQGWQAQALSVPTKYARVVHRNIRGKDYWFAQLIQQGKAPRLHATNDGLVGLDIGPSTIAVVSEDEASLQRFCPEVEQPWAEQKRQLRAMDRSRRATNPDAFDAKGRFKKGGPKLTRSMRYQKVAQKRRETERRLAASRKSSHGRLANRILAQGTTIKTESLSYKAFQKSYGRSVKVRAPGMFVSELRRKAAGAGGGVIEINTRTTKLSQFDHSTGDYVKKPLSQRSHVFGSGKIEPVQRDLYSAWLVMHCDQDTLDISQATLAWPGAEPLLRRAMSRMTQPVSRKGNARPHVRKRVGAGRPSQGAGRPVNSTDVVAKARAVKRPGTGTSRNLSR